jgi:hypothetical protein
MDRCFVTFIGSGCDVTRSLTSERRADIGIKRFWRDGAVVNFRRSQGRHGCVLPSQTHILQIWVTNIGFGGLVVSMLASGTQDRGFVTDRSRRIFPIGKKSTACLPSEGEVKHLSHVPALGHLKEPSSLRKLLAKVHSSFLR